MPSNPAIGIQDDRAFIPDGDNYDDADPLTECLALPMHPRAQDIRDKFDIYKKHSDATIADLEYFRNISSEVTYSIFFNQAPAQFSHYYTPIKHNIRAYALYRLSQEGKISLSAFSGQATLSTLKIGPHESVMTPAEGEFVITYEDTEGNKNDIILALFRHPNSVEWTSYASNAKSFADFTKLFEDELPRCNYYHNKVFGPRGEFLDLPSCSFSDIYLPTALREEIKQNIINYIDKDAVAIKQKNGIPTKRGVVFVGKPGTGKTFLSRVLANHLKTTFIVVSNLGYEDELSGIFDMCKMFDRVVILFEDIDIYVQSRELGGSAMLSTLLNHLDGMEVNNHIVVICTTNDVEAMDEALRKRPGRFDRILTFAAPDNAMKELMLKGFCGDKDVSRVEFKEVARKCPEHFTGAHLKELYITACNEAIDAGELDAEGIVVLTTTRFIHAIEAIKARKEPPRIGFGGADDEDGD